MAERLTKAAYFRAVDKPKRRFQRLHLNGNRLTLRAPVAGPSYWFERNDVIEEDGTYWRDRGRASITLLVDGVPSVLFFLVSRRLDTCTFAYHLTPSQLGSAVRAMRRARLASLIIPAAKWALTHMPKARRPVLEASLRELVQASG